MKEMSFGIIFTTIVFATNHVTAIFMANYTLTTLFVDKENGNLFIGAKNFIYKLDNDLKIIAKRNTTIVNDLKCEGDEVRSMSKNLNHIYLLGDLFGSYGLLACGDDGCATLNGTNLENIAVILACPAVYGEEQYHGAALMDHVNDFIIFGSTQRDKSGFVEVPYLTAYKFHGNSLERAAYMASSGNRPRTKFLFGTVVDEYRYFFTVNSEDGSQVIRLCEGFKLFSHEKTIYTYTELPLDCVDETGASYKYLEAIKVIHPGTKLAKSFGIVANDTVAVGLFRKSQKTLPAAVCVYSFKDMNGAFWKNIEKCFTKGSEVKRNPYSKSNCVKESDPQNCTSQISNNQKIVGTIPFKATSIVTCDNCDLSTSMDLVIYRNDTIAFFGTKSGNLVKLLISSRTSGRIYENDSRISGSEIISVNFEPNNSFIYMMTTNKIIKVPVEECSLRKTSKDCVQNEDPYCGWCTLYAECVTQDKCPDASSQLGYIQYRKDRMNVSYIFPMELPLSESLRRRKVNITINNLPPRDANKAYHCFINGINVTSRLIDGKTLECLAPVASQLPKASFETGKASVEVAVYSSETKRKILSTMMKFYNCTAITNCLNCTTGALTCFWCNYEARCIPDDMALSHCPNSYAPWARDGSKHSCPLLNKQNIYIPANIERKLAISATKLPKPDVNSSSSEHYKCVVSVPGKRFQVSATWNNATSLTCGLLKYGYAGENKVVKAKLHVELGKSLIGPLYGDVPVHLYKCGAAVKSCSACLGSWSEEYQCGWCSKQDVCVINDTCHAEDWIKPGSECSAKPVITSFYPATSPLAGNTKVEIIGTELGRKLEDITNVSIGNIPCKVLKEGYIIAKRFFCLTGSSKTGPFSAKMKIDVSGNIGYTRDMFYYQVPVVVDFGPKIGPMSGGTLLTITGTGLDTGRNITVLLGSSPCSVSRVTKTEIKCKTSSHSSTKRRRSTDQTNIGKTLTVTFDGSPPKSSPSTQYTYVPDANITNIIPRYTFPSSNTVLTVTGNNLNAIQNPKVILQFTNISKRFEKVCHKPTGNAMMCEIPDVLPYSNDDKVAKISLKLDSITKWEDLSGFSFGTIEFVPDPYINSFKETGEDIRILSTDVLEITGKNLVANVDRDLIRFEITVGGKMCNVTSKNEKIIYCKVPQESSLPNLDSFDVLVNVTGSSLSFDVGKLQFKIEKPVGSKDSSMLYIIIGVVAAVLLIVFIIIFCLYRRKRKQQLQSERTFELQINSLESKVAKECREAFAELQTDMTDFTTDFGGGGIHFFDFKNYAMRVLFPGIENHVVMQEKMPPESPKWEEALRTFSQLIGNKNFLLIFVKTLENQPQFKMQDRCNVASLLVIALQNKMEYCTEILQQLLAELIRKSMSKSHPKLLLRRTECVAEKLLTNWLTFTLITYIKDKTSKPLFMVYKAIKFQIEKGPVDAITNEARYSLSEDKLLRQSVDYEKLTMTVEYEDNPPIQVEVLDSDTIGQTKDKIMEVLFKNIPFSSRVPADELSLKWVESPSNHRILKDRDRTSIVEGDWVKINTLSHYGVPDRTCLRLVKRFELHDTSDVAQCSFSAGPHSPLLAGNQSFLRRSRNNLTDTDLRPWHLTKHSDYVQEKDDPRHSKLLSEIYLTRLLSTKGTLQQYVDDLFDSIFLSFRKNERPPLPIKFLFDFLDKQAKELNITDPEVLHTWKNNSLPLRFWVNLIKNPNFLFDVYKAPIVDSCLTVIAQLFMDACSVSEHRLGKDSPSNKLLYAKEIPAYKQKVERFYQEVSDAPSLTDDEMKNFFSIHHNEEFNIDNALKELYKYAATYQDELQEAFEDSRYPQLASKLEHVVAIFSDD